MNRQEKSLRARELHDSGLTWKQVGEHMGVSLSMAHDYATDPDGTRGYIRRHRNDGTCVDCGAPTHNGGGATPPRRCSTCEIDRTRTLHARRAAATRGASRTFSEADMLRHLRAAAVDGRVTSVLYDEYRSRVPEAPSRATIVIRFRRWAAAAEAAGLRARFRVDGDRSDRIPDEGLLQAIVDCTAEIGTEPSAAQYEQWAAGSGPSLSLISQRFGGWLPACDKAFRRAA
jgi:hypothetical protein